MNEIRRAPHAACRARRAAQEKFRRPKFCHLAPTEARPARPACLRRLFDSLATASGRIPGSWSPLTFRVEVSTSFILPSNAVVVRIVCPSGYISRLAVCWVMNQGVFARNLPKRQAHRQRSDTRLLAEVDWGSTKTKPIRPTSLPFGLGGHP